MSRKKKIIIGLLAVVLLVALIGGAWFVLNNQQNTDDTNKTVDINKPVVGPQVCSQDIIVQAKTALNESNLTKLTEVYETTNKLKDADTDLNCLFIKTRYYMATANVVEANKYIDKQKELVDKGYVLSFAFGGNEMTIDDQKKTVNSMAEDVKASESSKESPHVPLMYGDPDDEQME